ncbi:hypothetical protein HMPREF9140_01175 [Prevotella micans F0438]|uniref:Uncharacterized protein n=1 Tax=Prevotella micans F0438 TaxID=883158 RepID=H1Q2N7_9BACT|nr:hypothetical protein HMPREF9140_01175 [Prevotella micans F0438]
MQTKLPINSFVEPFVTVGNRVYRDHLKNITLYIRIKLNDYHSGN